MTSTPGIPYQKGEMLRENEWGILDDVSSTFVYKYVFLTFLPEGGLSIQACMSLDRRFGTFMKPTSPALNGIGSTEKHRS